MFLFKDKITDGDGIRRLKGQLGYPCWRIENHGLAGCERLVLAGRKKAGGKYSYKDSKKHSLSSCVGQLNIYYSDRDGSSGPRISLWLDSGAKRERLPRRAIITAVSVRSIRTP